MTHNVTSITDYDHTYLLVVHDGRSMYIRKEYVTCEVNSDDTEIVNFFWHWYEMNTGRRLFYLDYNTVTTPSEGSADDLFQAINRMLISQHHFPTREITTDHTLIIEDAKCDLIVKSNTDVNITIPPNSSVDFHLYEEIHFMPYGTGTINFLEGTGVTLLSYGDNTGITGPYNCCYIRQIALNVWKLCGDITAFIDQDVQDFLDATGIADDTIIAALNTLVIELKQHSLWTLFVAIYPFVGGTAATHKYNLVNPLDSDAAFRLTFNGTITHDANGADPNGTTGYATTHIIPNTDMTTNSSAIGYYGGEDIAGGGTERQFGCFVSGANPCLSMGVNRAGNSVFDNNNFSTNRITAAGIASSVGLFIDTRTSSTVHKAFQAASQLSVTDTTANGSGQPTTKMTLFAVNVAAAGVTAANFTALRCKFAFATNAGLSDAQVSTLTTLVNQFQTDLGR